MSDRVVDNVIIRNAGVIYGDKSLGILGRNHESNRVAVRDFFRDRLLTMKIDSGAGNGLSGERESSGLAKRHGMQR